MLNSTSPNETIFVLHRCEPTRGLWHSFGLFLVVSLPWLYWLTITLRLLRMQTNIAVEMSLDVVTCFLMLVTEGFHSALINIYSANSGDEYEGN